MTPAHRQRPLSKYCGQIVSGWHVLSRCTPVRGKGPSRYLVRCTGCGDEERKTSRDLGMLAHRARSGSRPGYGCSSCGLRQTAALGAVGACA